MSVRVCVRLCVCALGVGGAEGTEGHAHSFTHMFKFRGCVYSTVWTGAGAQLVERLFSTQEALGWTPHYHINEMRRCMSYMSVILELRR